MDSTDESKPRKEERTREELAGAFPLAIRQDALAVTSSLSENRFSSRWRPFSLHLGDEILALPQRIYYDPPRFQTLRFNALQREILNCLFTRHHDGFVRQKHLVRIIRSPNPWIPCFVIPLIGEYVVQILEIIRENLGYLDKSIYAGFVHTNPDFISLTEKRVISYWNCYYRSQEARLPRFLDSRPLEVAYNNSRPQLTPRYRK
ncbi:MAG TPA: hypothetical protein VGJ06_20315 [Candidatus Acidoferrum sp.]|jgi:hypothetical protein